MFDLDTLFEAPRERPNGVTRVAVLVCIQGIFRLFVALFFLAGSLFGRSSLPPGSALAGTIAGVLIALLGLLTVYFAWGLWTLKRWALWGAVALMVLNLAGSAFEFTLQIPVFWTILGMIIPVVVLIYFLAASRVRRAFVA